MTSEQIRQSVTEQIVRALESDSLPPWRKPWRCDPNAGHPANAASRRPYSGVNPLLLEIAAQRHGFTSRWWATFNQWSDLGGRVKARPAHLPPGRWGTQIVLCKPVKKAKVGDEGEEADERFFVLRSFTVFNSDQVEGPFGPLRVGQAPVPSHEVERRYEHADAVIEATGAEIRQGNKACYSFGGDFIQIPPRERFVLPEYYETVFHELVHWTEHPSRLNWGRSNPQNSYALGELVAELGGCYVSAELGLPTCDHLTNHAAYLKNWLVAMKQDSGFIFRASSQASKAADFILSFSRAVEPVCEAETVLTA